MDRSDTRIQGTIASGGRLDRALAEACPAQAALSRERIKALIMEGRVEIDGKPVTQPSFKAANGARFAILVPATTALDAVAQDIPLVIAYEDEHLIVVDKPAGLVVHPAAGNPDGTLVNALLHHCRGQLSGIGGVERPGIVHRIDKDTSGLLVIAKSDMAHEGLSRQFADHSIERAYFAIAHGLPTPPNGTLTGIIARHPTDRKRMALIQQSLREEAESGRGKHVITHYRLVEALDYSSRNNAALIECRLETGRTHQVRVHMASIGHPLVGDPVYCRSQKSLKPLLAELGFERQALHAAVLGFNHPVTGEAIRLVSEMPEDMRELLDHLGSSNTNPTASFPTTPFPVQRHRAAGWEENQGGPRR
jgi:23S rRNA pseudouridine1911/1915/1917 synthase